MKYELFMLRLLGKKTKDENIISQFNFDFSSWTPPRRSTDSIFIMENRSGKRQHSDKSEEASSMDVDDLVTMISTKLENLETSDSIDSLIAVFMEVLKCNYEEAAFFLDSVSGIKFYTLPVNC